MPNFDWKTLVFLIPVITIPIATAVMVVPPTLEQQHLLQMKQCNERGWSQDQAPQYEEFCRLYLAGKY